MNGGETLVEFSIGKSSLILDYNTGELKELKSASFEEIHTRSYPVYSSNGSAYSAQKYGKQIFGVYCSCGKCGQYGYTLQVHLDLDLGKIICIFLNSETLSFEKGSLLHEIRNIYSTGKTDYRVFDNDNVTETKTLTLPLIPMDLSDPDKTLERIKTLALFS
jgi:hypothetical protein